MQTAAVWEELCAIGTRRRFRAGDHLVVWGAEDHRILAIVDGICKVVNSTADGRETLATVRGPGEILGELAALTGDVRSSSVIALSAGEVVLITSAEFDRWLDEVPGAGRRLSTMLAERVIETTRFGIGAQQRVDVRLADRILFLADRFGQEARAGDEGGGTELRTSLTHEDLAAWVGATRAVTTRALGSLRDRGLIDFGRGWIRVVDGPGLRALCRGS